MSYPVATRLQTYKNMWKTQTIFQAKKMFSRSMLLYTRISQRQELVQASRANHPSELQRPHRVCTPSSPYSGLAEIVKLGKPYPRTFEYSLGISNCCLNKLDKRKQSHRFNDFSKIITCHIISHFQNPCAQHFLAILASQRCKVMPIQLFVA